ncbi:MAG TPA: sn-glycerol-3-phosphate ABC transporter ATP-binding protein UgpC [Devosia sp.]|nr:sn-glycerol-3-phosphate ABC transporter ATP-binding protein UgpC [Devosia sp.]
MAEIALRHVEKSYGKSAVVHGLDLDIASREFVVILGPSGCGKSTLLRMIAGLETITGGEISIDGAVVNKLEPRERGCAMVFQNYALYPHMSVADNIGYALKVAGVSKAERRIQVEEIAKSVGLETYLDRRPAQLSGGQRQRVAMARAMIRKPKVFLFDEPLSNLDAILRVQMRVEIRKLHRRLGTTSVFVTHDQAEAMTLADKIVVMRAGYIEQVGTPTEVYNRPATRFVASFIGSPPMNLVEGAINAEGAFVPAGDPSVALPLGRTDLGGRNVIFGIRPESLAAAVQGPLVGMVDFVEELGASRVIHFDWAGQLLLAVQSEGAAPAAGAAMPFGFAPEAVHLFSAEDGLRLDAPPAMAAPREYATA